LLDRLQRGIEEQQQQPKAIESFTPSRTQLLATAVLIKRYPRRLMMEDLAHGMAEINDSRQAAAAQGEIASEMEDLVRRNVVHITEPGSPMAYYGLTTPGRDFMLALLKRGSSAR
jgi:hypothetical protein